MWTALSRRTWSVFALVLLVGYHMLSKSAQAVDVDGLKTEIRENGAHDNSNNGNIMVSGNRRNLRSVYGLGPKMLQISRSKIPIELDLLVENDDGDRSKRFDDYGHMRFGKRGGEEQFDDYGHMRFGRSV